MTIWLEADNGLSSRSRIFEGKELDYETVTVEYRGVPGSLTASGTRTCRDDQVAPRKEHTVLTVKEVTMRQNYGLALEHSSRFFDAVRTEAAATLDPGLRDGLNEVLGKRDSVTAV